VETIEFNRDKGIGITVYSGQRKGYASTSDFSAQALRETVEAALTSPASPPRTIAPAWPTRH
jgi:PmbA protein